VRGGSGAAGSVREGGRGGMAWWAGSACLAARGQKASWAGWPLGQKLKKFSFLIKIEFLNMPRLWKFAQGDLRGIWLKDFSKILLGFSSILEK
jgi:hypothetical protein